MTSSAPGTGAGSQAAPSTSAFEWRTPQPA